MPTPPLTDAECLAALDAFRRHHKAYQPAADELGLKKTGLEYRIKVGRARGLDVDPAIKESMAAVGTGLVPALAWAKTKSKDGTSYSVLLKPGQDDGESLLDRIREAMSCVEAIPAIPAPDHCDDDLLTLYPIADAHLGMMAWGKETGEDYNTQIGHDRIIS